MVRNILLFMLIGILCGSNRAHAQAEVSVSSAAYEHALKAHKEGRLIEAGEYYYQALVSFDSDLGINHIRFAEMIAQTAKYLIDINFLSEAESCAIIAKMTYLKAAYRIKENYTIKEFLTVYYGLITAWEYEAKTKFLRYDYEGAANIYKTIMDVYKDLEKPFKPMFIEVKMNLAITYLRSGIHDEQARDLFMEIQQAIKDKPGLDPPDRERSLDFFIAISIYFCSTPSDTNQKELFRIAALRQTDKSLNAQLEYAESLHTAANYDILDDKFEQADSLLQIVLTTYRNIADSEQTRIDSLNKVGHHLYENLYAIRGYNKGLPLELNSRSLVNHTLLTYYMKGRYQNALDLYRDVFEYTKKRMITNAYSYGRWEEKVPLYGDILTIKEVQTFTFNARNNQAIALLYDTELFAKASLNTSPAQMTRGIDTKKHPKIADLWEKMRKLKSKQNTYFTAPDNNFYYNLKDALDIFGLEKEIIYHTTQLRGHNEWQYNWEDVANSLKEGEAAIEFLSLKARFYPPDSTIQYCALVITPDRKYPQLVVLCKEDKLTEAYNRSVYPDQEVASLIWKPVEAKLGNCQKLYISTSGRINNIAFAGIKTDSGYLSDKYQIHYVSSTANLCKTKESCLRTRKKAVLMGGIDYSIRKEGDNEPSGLTDTVTVPLARMLFREEDPTRGQGFGYLPGTKKEVDNIDKLLSEKGWEVQKITSEKASESYLKSLYLEKSPQLLHISTHGFYIPKGDGIPDSSSINIHRDSKHPFIRMGLALAGANEIWNSKNIDQQYFGEGILIAYKISRLNLSNTDLVVLSACKTGINETFVEKSSFSLPKSFRTAGAGAVLSTLWEVPDKETAEFMKEFYTHWNQQSTVWQAFTEAQRIMRNKYPDELQKWAGFVLVE